MAAEELDQDGTSPQHGDVERRARVIGRNDRRQWRADRDGGHLPRLPGQDPEAHPDETAHPARRRKQPAEPTPCRWAAAA